MLVYSSLIEGIMILLYLFFAILIFITWYYERRYRKNKQRQNIKEKKYPIVCLERHPLNRNIFLNKQCLTIDEFLLFTMLFRTIREYKPLTCTDSLAWYHYVYYISGCVFNKILSVNIDNRLFEKCDSTTFFILESLSSYEDNQLYIDYIYGLNEGDFNIVNDTYIRGNKHFMIKDVNDLLKDTNIVKN
uniref:Wsv021-like protein n=1 Tax=Trachysalambria curvirostris majanivirus TaxID=2984281 RepID=A0A9C7F731_9VIRU|nr:MAG: wsv021-like protein [Trachysalambria curvirostris majanivirus]